MSRRSPPSFLAALAALLPLFASCSETGIAWNSDDRSTAFGDEGWRTLFDGQTLSGWTTHGGRYDGNARWTVEDGAITGRQNEKREGGLIYTETPYTDFELDLEVRLDEPFDSGIFLRMAPGGRGAQVTLDVCPNGEVGAIYSDGFLQHNEGGRARWKTREWNRLQVKCTGKDMHVVAWINGEELVDYTVPEGTPGFAPTGLIGLQVHGDRDDPPQNKVLFRNVRVRDLAPTETTFFTRDANGFQYLTPWGRANGWTELFDGHSLAGWEPLGAPSGYAAQDGVLALLTKGESETIATKEDFTDFDLRFDFKLAEMANSGLFLRAARDGSNPAFSGCEIQLLDDFHWEERTKSKLKPWQHTGSLYGSVASGEPLAVHPLGQWNTLEVHYQGTRIAAKLNGRELYNVDTSTLKPEQGTPFAERAKSGFIGLQRHAPELDGDAYAWFRNVFVRRL